MAKKKIKGRFVQIQQLRKEFGQDREPIWGGGGGGASTKHSEIVKFLYFCVN